MLMPTLRNIITVSDNDIIEVSDNDDGEDNGGDHDWSAFD
jgi:hypothetical protein